jgi:hypothetical protein
MPCALVGMPGHLALMRPSRYEIILDLSRIVIVILLYLAQDCAGEDYLRLWPCGSTALIAQRGSCPDEPGRCRTGSDGPLYQNNILAGDMVKTCNCSGHGLQGSNLYVDR